MSVSSQCRFVLIGAAGYIAPRHMKAIRDLGGQLVAALDPNDSVGVIDSYFPDAEFFKSLEELSVFLDKERQGGRTIDYVSICSPNHLHEAHIRFGLKAGANVICEKPLVLDVAALDGLAAMERETGRRVASVLQLRLHPSIMALREKVRRSERRYQVDLSYITSRGRWYHASWKGNEGKSGGVCANIGVHFFDMLSFVFGKVEDSEANLREHSRCAGTLRLERADVRWFLSIDRDDLPEAAHGKSTFRAIVIDGEELEFSDGFTELHTETYREIISGGGYGLDAVRPSIELVSDFRAQPIVTVRPPHTFSPEKRDLEGY